MKRIVNAMGKLNWRKRACAVFLLCGTPAIPSPAQTFTTLHTFDGTDGSNPDAGLVQSTDGNLYGTTDRGGANVDYGTVFKITRTGTLTTLYSFCSQSGCADGAPPVAGLVQATDGNFYGTTQGGGANSSGTVFKITPTGTLTTHYSFCSQSGCADGWFLYAGLIQATDGNFYGTTYFGGANGPYDGTVFKITASGMLTTPHSFDSGGGTNPDAALVQDTNGSFFGTAACNGFSFFHCDDGTVFRLSVHLGPFVETQPTSGKAGATVKILGTNLKGATKVRFNGTAAAFKVVSSSLITTTVPAGATTGKVQVVKPGGTFSSNVPFRVT